MTIGISISLYDKFEDLGILLDIVRRNWKDKYYISVCSNHPEATEKIASYKEDIDNFEKGAQIRYNPSDGSTSNNLKYRIHDTILRGCRGALTGPDVSHVFHVHADAWQLSEASLHSLVDEMHENDASVAFKIEPAEFESSYPPGKFPDQMWLIDAEDARETEFFDREALDFPPTYSVHFLWPMLCLSHFGWGGIHQYSNRTEEVLWDGKPVQGNPARPMFFNPKYGQTHIATEDFRGELGKALQAYYLTEFGLKNGKRIEEFIQKHGKNKQRLFAELDDWLADLRGQLRWYGLSLNDFDYDMRNINPFLNDLSMAEKLNRSIKLRAKGSLRSLYQIFKSQKYNPHDENLKNRMLDEYYRSVLRQEHFPPEALGDNTIFQDQELNND